MEQKYTVPYIQIQAFDTGQIPDPDCPLPERTLWWSLRDIYIRYKAGTISKDQGEKQKQKAMQVYAKDRSHYDMMDQIVRHQAKMWVNIEQAARRYAFSDNRTLEADALYEAIYSCKLKDIAPIAEEQNGQSKQL